MHVYKPNLTIIDFGDEKEEWDRIYPKEDQLEHIAKLKGIKLKEIWTRKRIGYNRTITSGVQLGFTHGLKNRMFEPREVKASPLDHF